MFILVNILFALAIETHAFYLSVLEMDIEKNRIIQMQVKIFADDLADAVRAETGVIVPHDVDYSLEDLLRIKWYFDRHLYIKSGLETKKFEILSYTSENEARWFVLHCPEEIDKNDVLVANYLMELFPAQSNMVRLSINGKFVFKQLNASEYEMMIFK